MAEPLPLPEDANPSLLPPARRAPWTAYQERLRTLRAELKRLDGQSGWLANGRGVTFLGAAGLFLYKVFQGHPDWAYPVAGVLMAAYIVLAIIHHRVSEKERRAQIVVGLNERGLARLSGKWHTFKERGEQYADGAHLYTPDLDVFGQGSLFQLIDETGTRAGEQKLASWLSAPAPADEVARRQSAVRELLPLVDFRQQVVTACRLVNEEKLDPARFLAWAEGPLLLERLAVARFLPFVLPPVTIGAWIAGRMELVPGWLFWVGLVLQLGVIMITKGAIAQLHDAITSGERGFLRFGPAFAAVETQPFKDALLAGHVRPLDAKGGEKVSSRLNSFSRLLSYAEQRRSQFHPVLNLLVLWDLIFFFRLESWKKANGTQVRAWFEALSEMEALISVATFAHDRPDFSWPTVSPKGPRFVAAQLGHPLLDAPVKNDVQLPGPKQALLITGSNMSGKTTLLRAMGANAVLALAGGPVCADSLELTVVHSLTSMRVKDSLERGVSYFYAEVQRLKAVLDAAREKDGQVLFLLDEILLGTNTKERQLASREVLKLLLATGACGGVSTHDLSLADLEKETGFTLRNMHFRDLVTDGKMTFDYRLREGVVDTTNALRVMALAGIPVRESNAPRVLANSHSRAHGLAFFRTEQSADIRPTEARAAGLNRQAMARLDPHSYADDSQPKVVSFDWNAFVDFERKLIDATIDLQLEKAGEGALDLDTRALVISEVLDAAGHPLQSELSPADPILGQRLRITLPAATKGVRIRYQTSPDASALQWLAPEQTAGRRQPFLFSQCQAIHARSVVPLQDSPAHRVTFTATVTTPRALRCVMAAGAGERKIETAFAIETFAMPQPIAPYLFAFAVGELESRELGARTRVWAEPSVVEAAAWEFADTDAMITAAESLFGPYDWDRFDILTMPPSFPYGGMENPRLTFITPTLLAKDRSLVSVIAHELAHSWTGNLVTNANAEHFWLNEGFTVYAERRILEALSGRDVSELHAALGRRSLEQAITASSDHPELTKLRTQLTGIDPDEAFSLVPYEKGYLLLRALEEQVGRGKFDAFIKSYMNEYRFKALTTEEFVAFTELQLPGALTKVHANDYLNAPGLPSVAPMAQSKKLDALRNAEPYEGWSPTEWQLYLESLPKSFSVENARSLNDRFGLNASGNYEVLVSWLQVAVRSGFSDALPRLAEVVSSVGRMKYLKPLYKTLLDASHGDTARELFEQNKRGYHPIAKQVIDAMLKKSGV